MVTVFNLFVHLLMFAFVLLQLLLLLFCLFFLFYFLYSVCLLSSSSFACQVLTMTNTFVLNPMWFISLNSTRVMVGFLFFFGFCVLGCICSLMFFFYFFFKHFCLKQEIYNNLFRDKSLFIIWFKILRVWELYLVAR